MRIINLFLVVSLLACPAVFAAEPVSAEIQVTALFRGKALLSINGQPKLLANGESDQGVSLLSADSRRALVLYQGIEQELLLNQRIGGGYQQSAQPQMQIWPDARGMYYTTGTINGFGVTFLIDTGATSVAMNSATARRIGIDYRLRGTPHRVATASAVVTGYGLTLKQVTVGGLSFSNIDAVVIEGEQPSEILLGMSYLGRLAISHEKGAMVLKQKY